MPPPANEKPLIDLSEFDPLTTSNSAGGAGGWSGAGAYSGANSATSIARPAQVTAGQAGQFRTSNANNLTIPGFGGQFGAPSGARAYRDPYSPGALAPSAFSSAQTRQSYNSGNQGQMMQLSNQFAYMGMDNHSADFTRAAAGGQSAQPRADPFLSADAGFGTGWTTSNSSVSNNPADKSTSSLPTRTASPAVQTGNLQTSLRPPQSHRHTKSVDIVPPAKLQHQRSKSVDTPGAAILGVSRHPNWTTLQDDPESPVTLKGPSPIDHADWGQPIPSLKAKPESHEIRRSRKMSAEYKSAAMDAINRMAEEKKREASLPRRGKKEGALDVGGAGYYLDL